MNSSTENLAGNDKKLFDIKKKIIRTKVFRIRKTDKSRIIKRS